MASLNIKNEFDRLSTNGCIGDPKGKESYAYCRVSSAQQAETGKTGLPRQLEHIHEIARDKNLKITWENVYFDDHSGFELERPSLDRLRKDCESPKSTIDCLVIEDIDRLSRETWHQDFLLADLSDLGIELVSWEPLDDPAIRLLRGYAAKQAMKSTLARMREGKQKRAKNGQVISPIAPIGYSIKTEGQNRAYEIDQNRNQVIEYIYQQIAGGTSVNYLVQDLNSRAKTDDNWLPPRAYDYALKIKANPDYIAKRLEQNPNFKMPSGLWQENTIRHIVRSTTYVGQLVLNQDTIAEVRETIDGTRRTKKHKKRMARDESEHITIAVPPIVDIGIWNQANAELDRARDFAAPNRKRNYLLSGLIKCDECGRAWNGQVLVTGRASYYCSTKSASKEYREKYPCHQPSVLMDVMDKTILDLVRQMAESPDILISWVKKYHDESGIEDTKKQITFLEKAIEQTAETDDKHYKAYMAGAFNEKEFAAKKKSTENERESLRHELQALKAGLYQFDQIQKHIENLSAHIRDLQLMGALEHFEFQQQLVRMLIDKIIINHTEGWFKIVGKFGVQTYPIYAERKLPV